MSAITTHVLDTGAGRPGAGVPVVLERKTQTDGWQKAGEGTTDIDGRISDLLPTGDELLPGDYRLIFETGKYFMLRNIDSFFPHITISFVVKDAEQHYHVPLLLSPFGYSTYRGS